MATVIVVTAREVVTFEPFIIVVLAIIASYYLAYQAVVNRKVEAGKSFELALELAVRQALGYTNSKCCPCSKLICLALLRSPRKGPVVVLN